MRIVAGIRPLLAGCLLLAVSSGQQRKPLPPDYERKMEAIRGFESGVVPLFALGDLNEDGTVDQKDLELLNRYLATRSTADISCLAAADLSRNGAVDKKDAEILQQVLKSGKVDAPALAAQSPLPCSYKNFFVAARSHARAGGIVPVHFLNPRFTAQTSKVTVVQGQATVSRRGDAYQVQVNKDAAPGSMVTLSFLLSDGKKYLYTFPVDSTK